MTQQPFLLLSISSLSLLQRILTLTPGEKRSLNSLNKNVTQRQRDSQKIEISLKVFQKF